MKMIMKRKGLVLLALCLALLTGCASKETELVTVPTPTPELSQSPSTPEPTPTPVQTLSLEQQQALFEQNRELWAFTDPYDSPWFYTFTDLDRNGRLEVLAAVTQGSGIFTYVHFWEVKPDYSGIDNCYHKEIVIEGPDDWPEIIRDSLPCYYDSAADRCYYPCENLTRDGYAHQYYGWYALCLKDGVAEWELLATKSVEYDENGGEHVSCADAAGAPIAPYDYDDAVATRFDGMQRSEIALSWTQVDVPFEEAPVETPAVTPDPASVGITVTKNPSSEALSIGGKTWFIAHADNGAAPTWFMLSPDGQTYTLGDAMAAHPGLELEVLPKDTIAVSNVPLSVNGWAVIARFDGADGYVLTEPAYLYVGDYLKAYGSVIDAYRYAFTSGLNTDTGYMLQSGLSEMASTASSVGYAFKDLDKDGVPELLIAGLMPIDKSYTNLIYDVYTLSNGAPVQLAISSARCCYYVRTDSSLYWEGAGGAMHTYNVVERVKGGKLESVESLFTDQTADGSLGWFTRKGGIEDASPSNSTSLTEAEYQSRLTQLESTIYLPQLTKIN